ncbi:hypothetical protein Bbelb_119570 [Branchiostoma belcheri]|nr:hypothetical protein Bbelb_119570 [Branchiostoma belcheri]
MPLVPTDSDWGEEVGWWAFEARANFHLRCMNGLCLKASNLVTSFKSGGGTFMRSTTASNKMTHKTKVRKGDETVENVAEASETSATMEAGHIPAPPPLPTREQLRRASLAQAVIHPRVHGVGFGRVPSPPALPPMELLMSGISHGSGLVPPPPALPPMELLISEITARQKSVSVQKQPSSAQTSQTHRLCQKSFLSQNRMSNTRARLDMR